jgi:hypothetical protein
MITKRAKNTLTKITTRAGFNQIHTTVTTIVKLKVGTTEDTLFSRRAKCKRTIPGCRSP